MVAFARAEDAFDLGERLGDITAPTLVIAGERDTVYSPDILRRTADGVRNPMRQGMSPDGAESPHRGDHTAG
jgi:pimeloyl-ACP methyl ester carboxylesterase